MSDQWYLTRNNQKYGPYSSDKMKEFAAQGNLTPTDMVMQDGTDKLVPASTIFFPSQPPPPPIPAPVQLQSPPKKKPGPKELIAGCFMLVLLLLCAGGIASIIGKKDTANSVPGGNTAGGGATTIKDSGGDPGIKIFAGNLLQEYKQNEAAANQKYLGKKIEVNGIVKRTTNNFVELHGGGGFELLTVDCYFSDKNTLATFTAGTQVTITGVCDGKNPFAVKVKNCTLNN